MTQREVPQAAIIGADSSWLIPFAILLVVGLLIAVYRLCIIQSVQENGRVVTRCRWPIRDLLPTDAKIVFRLADPSGAAVNPRMKALLSKVYNGQEIVFGVLVYSWGVCMAALAMMQFGESPILLSPTQTVLSVVLGSAAMMWGVFTVVRRKRNNPFTDKDLVL